MTAPRRYSIAMTMIARNEAPRIARALASVRPHVDRLLVLDTGSSDETVRLARAAGAEVRSFRWCDDFAAARNAALDAARADWHVVLDADEWVAAGGPVLAALRTQAPQFVGALRIDSQYDQQGTRATAPSWLQRVLPGAVRYTGSIHEHPVHQMPVHRLGVAIGHDGYLDTGLAAKAGRNRRLLQAALAKNPGDAYLHYQLGKDHDVYERYADAIACFAAADAACAGAGTRAPAWHHDLLVRWLHALKRCHRHAEAMLLAESRLARWTDSPDVHFALGDLLLDWAAEEPARATDLLPLVEGAWLRCLSIGERPDLEGAVAGRGSLLAARNLAVLYDGTGRVAEAARMRAQAD